MELAEARFERTALTRLAREARTKGADDRARRGFVRGMNASSRAQHEFVGANFGLVVTYARRFVGQGLDITRCDQQAGLTVEDRARNPAHARRQDRQPRRHPLQDRHRQRFVLAGENEQVGRREQRGDVLAVAEHADRGVAIGEPLDHGALGAIARERTGGRLATQYGWPGVWKTRPSLASRRIALLTVWRE